MAARVSYTPEQLVADEIEARGFVWTGTHERDNDGLRELVPGEALPVPRVELLWAFYGCETSCDGHRLQLVREDGSEDEQPGFWFNSASAVREAFALGRLQGWPVVFERRGIA